MIDHLLRFTDRAAAGTALAPLGLASESDNFAANIILNVGGPNDESVRVILQDAVWDHSDPENPVLTTPEVLAPGWYCVACEPLVNVTLRDLPDNACRLIADRKSAVAGDPNFIVYTAPDLDPDMFATARVEPLPLGGRYPFGGH